MVVQMSMNDATLGDIYRDRSGAIYRVVWTCHEPTVGLVYLANTDASEASFIKNGGVSGQMWEGFERIYKASRE